MSQLNEMVGPVFVDGDTADCFLEAIRQDNPEAEIHNNVSYIRVSAPKKCVLNTETLEPLIGYTPNFPQDLEMVMCSFQGKMSISPNAVTWEL